LIAEGPPIASPTNPCSVNLATAIPKGERFDWLVEKATELGVDRLTPLVTERSVVDPRGTKLDRLRRTIIEASKQARRTRLMDLDPPRAWPELVQSTTGALCLIALPHGQPPSRWPCLIGLEAVVLAIGPEGGFTPAEEDLARSTGWHPIKINPNVLRIETAAIAGTAAVMTRCREGHGDGRD
jgi:16S rRNA (uracil1498-N3)-methyltransferase